MNGKISEKYSELATTNSSRRKRRRKKWGRLVRGGVKERGEELGREEERGTARPTRL